MGENHLMFGSRLDQSETTLTSQTFFFFSSWSPPEIKWFTPNIAESPFRVCNTTNNVNPLGPKQIQGILTA